MAGYNRIIMVGNLTRDPELKPVGNQSVCKLNIAANRQYKNKQTGTLVQEVCFIDAEVWGVQADSCKAYLSKGKPVLIEGRLKLDSWKDAEGSSKSKHSIVAERIIFLNSNSEASMEENNSLSSSNFEEEDNSSKNFESAKKDVKKVIKTKNDFSFSNNPPFSSEEELPF